MDQSQIGCASCLHSTFGLLMYIYRKASWISYGNRIERERNVLFNDALNLMGIDPKLTTHQPNAIPQDFKFSTTLMQAQYMFSLYLFHSSNLLCTDRGLKRTPHTAKFRHTPLRMRNAPR